MNYTTIEQSKKLVELGLDTNTADMWWQEGRVGPEPVIGNYALHIQCMKDCDYRKIHKTLISPAWSLGALLELMPESYQLTSNKDNKYQFMLINNPKPDWFDTPFESVYNMVCWLLENGYIK